VVLVGAYTVAAWVGVGCFYSEDMAFQWRFPLALQCLWPLLLICTLPVIPESPRWRKFALSVPLSIHSLTRLQVLMQDRKSEAWHVLSKLHGQTDESEVFAREELYQIQQQIQEDRTGDAQKNIFQLLRKASHRKRFFCAFMVMFAAQSSGNTVIYSKCRTGAKQASKVNRLRLQCSTLQRLGPNRWNASYTGSSVLYCRCLPELCLRCCH
jgi:hypothetical protein